MLFHHEQAEIMFAVDKLTGDAAMDWYMQEFGGGVFVHEPKNFDPGVFIRADSLPETEDLECLSRSTDSI